MTWTSLLLAAVLLFCGNAAAADTSYGIRGVLISAKDGAVIPHGHLEATLAGDRRRGRFGNGPPPAASVEADDQGSFALTVPAPGVWRLTASAPGFRSAALDEHDGYFTGVALSPSTRSVEVTFRLEPDAAIIGYVLDEAGEAVRNAQITLLAANNNPETTAWQRRSTTRADDRGYYEFPALAPGHYQVVVQAQPWYTIAVQRRFGAPAGNTADSLLDVTYPLTWYPGVTDASATAVVTLEGGGIAQADVRLTPVPALHLRIAAPTPPLADSGDRGPSIPQIQLLWPQGGATPQPLQPSFGPHGDLDVGGLAPGTYQISTYNVASQPYLLHLGSGSSRTVDLNAAVPTFPVSLIYDLSDGSSPPQIQLIDTATGQIVFGDSPGNNRLRPRFDLQRGEDSPANSSRLQEGRNGRTVNLAPGRYEVRLANEHGAYLTSLSAVGADVSGRFFTTKAADCQITVHLAVGRATLTGTVAEGSLPVAGAMLLLVPATWGDPRHFTPIERGQSNTDGSFRLTDLAPGQYILIAIDHGWHISWSDPAILRPYLLHGVPIDLTTATSIQEIVPAQQP